LCSWSRHVGAGDGPVADVIDDVIDEAIVVAEGNGGESDEDPPESDSSDGFGTASVVLNGTSYELVVRARCLMSALGIGASADGDGTKLEFAGFEGAATLLFEVDGLQWIAAAAPVMSDGDLFVYDATVTSSEGTVDLMFTVACTEFTPAP
jgi:hypothetical protein